jgi:site-specific DNA-methyltransferase (adenine-specific)
MTNAHDPLAILTFDYRSEAVGHSRLVHADCFEWFSRIPESSLHAIVTNRPTGCRSTISTRSTSGRPRRAGYGEYPQRSMATSGHRFPALNNKERETIREFFMLWARAVAPALRPGAQVFIASNAFISLMVFSALVKGGRSSVARS